MPKLIDSHAHINFQAFASDHDGVIERSLSDDVWLINVGTQFETSRRAVEMAESYSDGVYAAVGLHPIHLFEHHVDEEETSFNAAGEEFNADSYKELVLRSTKVVAIGEFGLDYYRMPPGEDAERVKKVQREVVKQHLMLAEYLDKPVNVHCRDLPASDLSRRRWQAGAYDELFELLEEFRGQGNIHSFTGTWEQAEKFLNRGLFIGLNGIITFDKTGRSEEVVKNLPLERIVLETDAPYLTPIPHRGKRNEPAFTKFVAQKIAEIKEIDVEEVEEQTTKNARELFRI